jgi:putative ABC transport system permease protein
MARNLPLAWLQMTQQKPRLIVALAGVAFAVILVSMQLAFRTSIYESGVRYHRTFDYELAMLSPKTSVIALPESFSRRRLYQTLAADGVVAVTPVYIRQGIWKNPWKFNSRNILVVGFDPARDVLKIDGVSDNLDLLKLPDVVLFDASSRPEFGPVAEAFRAAGPLDAELNNRKVTVAELFLLGTSFGIDGSVVTSDLNYLRVFPDRPKGFIELGLIHLAEGVSPAIIRSNLRATLEQDVEILTRPQFIERERQYWATTTPVGYVFGFGAIMGLIVGCVVVYQILYADVSEHLAEYATLKAIGYRNRDLSFMVLRQAGLLALLGYVPGMAITFPLYAITADATRLPMEMTFSRALAVLLLTVGMCAIAGLMALRQVRAVDPAEVFN